MNGRKKQANAGDPPARFMRLNEIKGKNHREEIKGSTAIIPAFWVGVGRSSVLLGFSTENFNH